MSTQKYASKLSGTRVLIIGGTSGIGFGVAEALIEYNAAFIAISSSNPSRVDTAIKRLHDSYPDTKTQLQGLTCNLGDQDTLESNVKHLYSSLDLNGNKLDHIVYTAGDPLAASPLSSIDVAFAVKAGMVRYFGPMMVAKHAPEYLKPGPDASIVLTTGAVSQKPIPGWTAVAGYATGLHGLTRNLALDMKPTRVNLISPGAVDTELWDTLSKEEREGLMEKMKKGCSTGRIGRVEDVVESYLYVMRDGNISGSVVSTNGGALIM